MALLVILKDAVKIMEKHLKESEIEMNRFGSANPGYENPNIELVILHEQTREYDFGWVFFYDSKQHMETQDVKYALAGNAPMIVDRNSGELVVTGTSHGIEWYINNYIKYGDPHNEIPRS